MTREVVIMKGRCLTKKRLEQFKQYLLSEEKSRATVEKYLRDTTAFFAFVQTRSVSKTLVIEYKQALMEKGYAVRSINSMLSSINSLFSFLGWYDCKVKTIKQQRQIFCGEDKELTKAEYLRLLNTATKTKNERLNLIIQTICSTGIRVSELQYITVEAVSRGEATVNCKGKTRTIIIVKQLRRKLLQYAKERHMKTGPVFVTRSGNPVSRTNIWREMKSLCEAANVNPSKVFPHNLRHLFARTFYGIEKDIAKLADILGHSSINTTRIYIISTGEEHRKRLENMRLVI